MKKSTNKNIPRYLCYFVDQNWLNFSNGQSQQRKSVGIKHKITIISNNEINVN